MTDRTAILFVGDADWQVGATSGGRPMSPRPVQTTVADAMTDRPRRVVIGLASHLCLTGSLNDVGSNKRQGRPALIYRLEEHVPLAAEEMLADFLPHDGGLLGICSAQSHVRRPLAALAELRVAAAAICPTALLALQHLLNTQAIETGRWDVLLWRYETQIEAFILSERGLVAWQLLPDDSRDVARMLFVEAERRGKPLGVAAVGMEPAILAELRAREPTWQIEPIESTLSLPEAATGMADAIVAGRAPPMVDLRAIDAGESGRHGRLSGAGRAVAVAAAVMCAAMIVAMVIRGVRYQGRTADADAQMRSAFARVFPHAPVPLGIEARLRSTYQSLGVGSAAGSRPSGANDRWLLPLLHHTLASLPGDVRFHVDSLRLEDHQFVIEGQVLSIADADALAAALGKSPELSVDEPQTERTDSAVSFTLTGSMAGRAVAQGGP